eukprot:SAG31_NODE_7812_length_1590_cov_169.191818_1_plen_26_part_10
MSIESEWSKNCKDLLVPLQSTEFFVH